MGTGNHIAAVAICMVGWLSITSKKTELIQESNAAANQLRAEEMGTGNQVCVCAASANLKDESALCNKAAQK